MDLSQQSGFIATSLEQIKKDPPFDITIEDIIPPKKIKFDPTPGSPDYEDAIACIIMYQKQVMLLTWGSRYDLHRTITNGFFIRTKRSRTSIELHPIYLRSKHKEFHPAHIYWPSYIILLALYGDQLPAVYTNAVQKKYLTSEVRDHSELFFDVYPQARGRYYTPPSITFANASIDAPADLLCFPDATPTPSQSSDETDETDKEADNTDEADEVEEVEELKEAEEVEEGEEVKDSAVINHQKTEPGHFGHRLTDVQKTNQKTHGSLISAQAIKNGHQHDIIYLDTSKEEANLERNSTPQQSSSNTITLAVTPSVDTNILSTSTHLMRETFRGHTCIENSPTPIGFTEERWEEIEERIQALEEQQQHLITSFNAIIEWINNINKSLGARTKEAMKDKVEFGQMVGQFNETMMKMIKLRNNIQEHRDTQMGLLITEGRY